MLRKTKLKAVATISVCIGIALFLSFVSAFDGLEFVEARVLRCIMFIQSEYSHKKEQSPQLALIKVDRKSESALGYLPWSYDILMPLYKILNKYEANTIGLFTPFEDKERIGEYGDSLCPLYQKNLAELSTENEIYKAKLIAEEKHSLLFILTCRHFGLNVSQLKERIHFRNSFWSGRYFQIDIPDDKPLRVPVDQDNQMMINFATSYRLPDMDSFIDVLNADNALKPNSNAIELLKYRDKLVLIGTTDATGTPRTNTPFGIMSEFALRSHAINTILSRSFIKTLTKKGTTVYLFAICLALSAAILWFDQKGIRKGHVIASSVFLGIHLLFCIVLFVNSGVWLNWISPAIALVFCGIVTKMLSSHLELKDAYQNLQKTQNQLIEAEKNAERQATVSRIRRTIFHDVKNGVNAMHLLLQNSLRIISDINSKESGLQQVMEKINKSIALNEKMMPIMINVLDFFDIKLDKRMNPAEIVRNVCKSMEDELEEAGIKMTIHENGSLPYIELNEERLFFAFHNLIKNASEAMSRGGTLEINMRFQQKQNQNVIEISDTGVGIPETELGRIFDWLYTTKNDGHGIGLAVAKMNIEAHRGKIAVKSKLGQGTTFIVTLPIV